MRIELIFTGDELLDGRVLNTNQHYICRKLAEEELEVKQTCTVGDSRQDLIDVIGAVSKRSDIVIMTGGLGPTEDDRTSEILAKLANQKLVQFPEALDHVKTFYARRNLPMPKANLKQSYFPEGCELIHNLTGSAPGVIIQLNEAFIFALPGVPFEMQEMINSVVIPLIKKKFSIPSDRYKTRIIKLFGTGESNIQEIIKPLYPLPENIELGFQVKYPEIHIRLKSSDGELIQKIETRLLNILQEFHFGYDSDTFVSVFANKLIEKQLTVSVLECFTGGLLTSMLTSHPDSSKYFASGIEASSHSSKINLLKIDPDFIDRSGSASKEVFIELVKQVRIITNTTTVLAVSDPVEVIQHDNGDLTYTLHIAAICDRIVSYEQFQFTGKPERIKLRVAYSAIKMLSDLVG